MSSAEIISSPAASKASRTAEVGHGGLDFPHVAFVAQIIGTGFERGFHQLVFGVLFLRELDDALAFELPAHTAVFAHGPAALAHQMADFGHGTVTVVGRGFHDDGDAARTVTFVVDFYDVAAGILPGTLADGGFDFILGEVDRLGSSNGRTQAGITGRDRRRSWLR